MGTRDGIQETLQAPLGESFVREGQLLEGKFRVERIIGEGSMGLVVEATHLALDERVALKFLRREMLGDPEVVARFSREAKASVKMKSDYVARVYDVGTAEDGSPFIVMEYLEGSDLATVLETRRSLDIPEAVEFVIQACAGLAEAHARGIVHRDIKPENLFVARGAGALSQIKVLDFGISKAGLGNGPLEGDMSGHTTQIMGSPHYMSPDQLRSTRDVDARADLWSLGVVLFELLAGRLPFPSTSVTGLVAKVLHDPHERLRTARPDVPAELEAVVDRCLEKDPSRRFTNAGELALALLPFAPKRARAVVERTVDIVGVPSVSAAAAMRAESPRASAVVPRAHVEAPPDRPREPTERSAAVPVHPEARRSSAIVWIAAGFIVLVGIAGGAFALMGGSPQQGVAPTGSAATPATGTWASVPADPTSGSPATSATAEDEPPESTPSTATTTQPHRPPSNWRPAPRPTPAKSTQPHRPDSEIRMER